MGKPSELQDFLLKAFKFRLQAKAVSLLEDKASRGEVTQPARHDLCGSKAVLCPRSSWSFPAAASAPAFDLTSRIALTCQSDIMQPTCYFKKRIRDGRKS